MDVRSVETARAEETDSHSSTGANESRKSFAVCGDEITSFSDFALCCGPFGYEVENEI
jgi:hypothetical protein